MTKIAFALIGWRSVDIPYMYCRDELRITEGVEVEIPGVGDALVPRSRDIVATKFLEQTDCDVLLSIDTDVTFKAEDAVQICEQAETHDIVAGLYVTRGRSERCKPTSVLLPDVQVKFGADPTPVPILWAGGGFLAVHRRVFDRLKDDLILCHEDEAMRHYPFYDQFPAQTPTGKWINLSEDYALCERARRAGFGVYLNPAVRLGHWGVRPFYLEDMLIDEVPQLEVWLTHNADGTYERYAPALEPKKDQAAKPNLILAR